MRVNKDKDAHKKVSDMAFKPPGFPKEELHRSLFEHHSDLVIKNWNYKDADGHVKTAPWNFTTNPAKKGDPATCPGTLF